MKIREASDGRRWDQFLAGHARSSIYHSYAWRGIYEQTYRLQTVYLECEDEYDAITGVLPLVRLRSMLFGDYMVSLPFVNYGGAIGRSSREEELLMEHASERASELGCTHVEFRDLVPRGDCWSVRTDKISMVRDLPSDTDTLWSELGSKRRSQIRRPQRENPETITGGLELMPEFYAVMSRNFRDIGALMHARGLFERVLKHFPESAAIMLVRIDGEPAAAAFLLEHGGSVEIPWASSLKRWNPIGVNMLLYWEALCWSIAKGCERFDFGRCTLGSGTHRFKKQWGAEPVQYYWHYWLRPGQPVPQLTPQNPRYQAAIGLWRRLPVPVTRLLGPLIVRNLP